MVRAKRWTLYRWDTTNSHTVLASRDRDPPPTAVLSVHITQAYIRAWLACVFNRCTAAVTSLGLEKRTEKDLTIHNTEVIQALGAMSGLLSILRLILLHIRRRSRLICPPMHSSDHTTSTHRHKRTQPLKPTTSNLCSTSYTHLTSTHGNKWYCQKKTSVNETGQRT